MSHCFTSLYVADPATFLASNSVPGTIFPLKTVKLKYIFLSLDFYPVNVVNNAIWLSSPKRPSVVRLQQLLASGQDIGLPIPSQRPCTFSVISSHFRPFDQTHYTRKLIRILYFFYVIKNSSHKKSTAPLSSILSLIFFLFPFLFLPSIHPPMHHPIHPSIHP